MNRVEVTATFTVEEARALLCWREECNLHPPEAKGAAWKKLARATQRVTRPEPEGVEEQNAYR